VQELRQYERKKKLAKTHPQNLLSGDRGRGETEVQQERNERFISMRKRYVRMEIITGPTLRKLRREIGGLKLLRPY